MLFATKPVVACVALALIMSAAPLRAADEAPHGLGLRMSRPLPVMRANAAPVAEKAGKKAPVTVFSLSGVMPAAMDQGLIGSCASCAVGYAWKSCTEGLRNGTLPNDDTRTFSPTYLYNQVNGGGDNGSYFEDNLLVLCMRGINTLADMPYSGDTDTVSLTTWPTQGQCDLARAHRTEYANAKSVTAEKTLPAVTPTDLAKIKALIMKGTPALLGIVVDSAFDNLPAGTTNYMWYPSGSGIRGNHAITLIGFNDAYDDGNGHVGGFEFQNSWGDTWCNEGRAYIAYDAFYGTGAVDGVVYYGVERKAYVEKLKARVTILRERRGRVAIQLGVGPVEKPKWSEWFYYPLVINLADEIWDDENSNIITTLDIDSGAKRWPPSTINDWWLKVVDPAGDGVGGSIVEFSIHGKTGWVNASGPVEITDMGNTIVHIGD